MTLLYRILLQTDAIVYTCIEAQLKSAREQLLELEQDLSLVKAKVNIQYSKRVAYWSDFVWQSLFYGDFFKLMGGGQNNLNGFNFHSLDFVHKIITHQNSNYGHCDIAECQNRTLTYYGLLCHFVFCMPCRVSQAIDDASSLAIQNAELSASCLQLNTAMSRASDLEGELSQSLVQSEHTLSLKQHQYEQNISMLQGDCEAVRSKLSLLIERVEVADDCLLNVLAREKAAVERCEQLDAQIRDLVRLNPRKTHIKFYCESIF